MRRCSSMRRPGSRVRSRGPRPSSRTCAGSPPSAVSATCAGTAGCASPTSSSTSSRSAGCAGTPSSPGRCGPRWCASSARSTRRSATAWGRAAVPTMRATRSSPPRRRSAATASTSGGRAPRGSSPSSPPPPPPARSRAVPPTPAEPEPGGVGWAITATGTVTLDDVTTPLGRGTEQQGGSAVYFSLAAAPFAPVHLVGVVGRDGEARLRQTAGGAGVDLAGLEVSGEPTFRWRATHDFERWVTACEHSDEGAYASWRPRFGPAAAAAEVLFLGSMPPASQLEAVAQSRARVIGADSMTVYIGGPERDRVVAVVEAADVLFLNRAELAALTGRPAADWR